ncbi:MAG: hypothetical protein IPN08_11835 [Bacteroidales bacterium]|nr:hypothetical protein [Bacteroidales bacterium]MBK9358064.1 hypothetical protein [Bacteroidales bacterium]
MRTRVFLSFLFTLSMVAVYAQKPLKTTDDSVKFGNTLCPGIWIDIPEVNIETIRSSWVKTIEKGTKSKAILTGNEITIFGALLKDITEAPVNIFSAINGQDSVVRLFAALELKRDEFTVINSREHEQLKGFIKQFAKDQYIKVAEDQLSTQESKLKDLEKELSTMRKVKEKLEKEIQTANTTISEENYKISSVKKELAVTESSLDTKSTELSTMEEGEAKKAVQSEVKDMQKQKKEQLKAISNSENKTMKSKTLIQDNNNEITKNLKAQDDLNEKISIQETEVRKYADKLKTIESY